MNKFLLCIFFVVFSSVHADPLDLGLVDPNAEKNLSTIIEAMENYKDGDSLFDTGNGDDYFTDFDTTNFDIQSEQEKLQADYPNDGDFFGDCVHEDAEPTKSLGAIKIMESNVYGSSALEFLAQLEETGLVKIVLSRMWDGMSGDSESCRREAYRVYFKNGKVLHINYDHTD